MINKLFNLKEMAKYEVRDFFRALQFEADLLVERTKRKIVRTSLFISMLLGALLLIVLGAGILFSRFIPVEYVLLGAGIIFLYAALLIKR